MLGVTQAGWYAGGCVGMDVQWHSVGVMPLDSVGMSSWCRGLFSGSNILVCWAVSAGERQEISRENSGCVACYLYLG